MVINMKNQDIFKRIVSVFLAAISAAMLAVPTALPVSAANESFITELRVAAGADAVDTLEAEGWSVMMVGLNITADPASQVYIAYKMNTGSPITNVVLSSDVGDSFTDDNGVTYECVSHVDVNKGIGKNAGCLYATRDEKAGEALVGLDVLRSSDRKEVLYPITNDGAQIVRTRAGAPADMEAGNGKNVVYLALIRDGIVRPYISEIGVITEQDKWNAVYTASERGYDYYVDGDIDAETGTYTIIGFNRTAKADEAVRGVAAVATATVKAVEESRIVDTSATQAGKATSAALTISGAEYVRISSKPVKGEEPFYIYRSKDKKAGNPISMLYAEKVEQRQNFMLGTWANGYFFSPGVTIAYTYGMNEDLFTRLWGNKTVLTKLTVRLLDNTSLPADILVPPALETLTEQPTQAAQQQTEEEVQQELPHEEQTREDNHEVTQQAAQEEPEQAVSHQTQQTTQAQVQKEEQQQPAQTQTTSQQTTAEKTPEQSDGAPKCIKLTVLTPRDGLPETAASITGMRGEPAAPYVEKTERSDRVNKYQASVFGKGVSIALIVGGVVIAAAAVYLIIRKKRGVAKDTKNPEQANKKNKQKKSPQKSKPKESR